MVELAALLGPAEFSRYLNTRILERARLQATAHAAAVEFYLREKSGEARIADITKTIRARITPGYSRVNRQQRQVGVIYSGSRTNSYRPPPDVRHVNDINTLPANFMGTVAIRFPARRGTRGNIISPGGTRYYELNQRLERIPAFTEAQAQQAIAARLASDQANQAYQAVKARYQTAQARAAGYRILG